MGGYAVPEGTGESMTGHIHNLSLSQRT